MSRFVYGAIWTAVFFVLPCLAKAELPIIAQQPVDFRITVSRAMMACYYDGYGQALDAKIRMQKGLADWVVSGRLPMNRCQVLQVGETYDLSSQQPSDAVEMILHCHGCVPYATIIYAPVERLVGRYLSKPFIELKR